MSSKKDFIDQVIKNLELNGFPNKKVSFGLEKMYEMADNKDLSFNDILKCLEKDHFIKHETTIEKVIFFKELEQPEINQDMYKQAQEMMDNMSSEEIENMKSMYENMSDEEKQNMMDQAKKMGLF